MKLQYFIFIIGVLLCTSFISSQNEEDWGFFGHRRINRLAVFTLPEEMLSFYKANINFITEHSVDPDKRRYAFRLEAPRHYLDMDQYNEKCLPENFAEAFATYSTIKVISDKNDTMSLSIQPNSFCQEDDTVQISLNKKQVFTVNKKKFLIEFSKYILPQYYDQSVITYGKNLTFLAECGINSNKTTVLLVDHFTEHGIVPYIISQYYNRLVTAFKNGENEKILKISAEFGHYIGDIHVPLHACSNYNGQKTNQNGIHAFWESRIPELFADAEYDYFVGKATYIYDVEKLAWNIIKESYRLSDTVLIVEKNLKNAYHEDQQFCFDNRLGKMVWTQCADFAKAYENKMNGMVENRMRAAISVCGSLWYSAWVDAGSPKIDINAVIQSSNQKDSLNLEYESAIKSGKQGFGRQHE